LSRRTPDIEGVEHVACDLANLQSLRNQIKLAGKDGSIDALVCNAGVPLFGELERLSPKDITNAIDINLSATILVTQIFLPLLKRNAPGDVIFIGSESALKGGKRGSVYCATKFAVRGFSQALREECAKSGVRVTLVNPGMVRTPFFDDLDFRPGGSADNAMTPHDVAQAIEMVLASSNSVVFDEINLTPLKRVIDFGSKS